MKEKGIKKGEHSKGGVRKHDEREGAGKHNK